MTNAVMSPEKLVVSTKRDRIEFAALIMAGWFLLITTTVLVVTSFGTFDDYKPLIWCSALFGLGIGCGGGLIGLHWLPRAPERSGAVIGSIFLLILIGSLLVMAIDGSIYEINLVLASVIRDNSAAMHTDKFVGAERARQFLAPLLLYSLLVLPPLFLVPLGREIQVRCQSMTGGDTFLWFSAATATAWLVALAVLLSPYFIILLPLVFGLCVIFASPKHTVVASVVALLLTAGSVGIYLTDWKGGWKATSSVRPELRETIRKIFDCGNRVDIFPMMNGESFAGLMATINRLPYGINLKPGLSVEDAKAVNQNVKGLEGFAPDFHMLAFANTTAPESKSVLIVGPSPANLTLAALAKGFKNVTVVCRSTIDYTPLELLHIPNDKVRVIDGDPFLFINSAQEKFDVIAMTGRYSHQTINVLAPIAKDDFLYTADAFRTMGTHLNSGGYIAIEYTDLDKISLNRLARTLLYGGQYFASHYETVGGGFLICAFSAAAGRPDAASLLKVKERWGSTVIKNPDDMYGKVQVKMEWPWTLDYPFRNYPRFRVLDMGHISATTVVTVIIFLLIRWSALGGVILMADRPAIMATAAAFMCIAGKASMMLAECFGTTEPALLIVQSLLFLLFLFSVPLTVSRLKLRPWMLLVASAVLILFCLVVDSGARFGAGSGDEAGGSLMPGLVVSIFNLLPATCLAGALGCYLRETDDSPRALSALFIGMSTGFLLNYGAVYNGISFLGVIALLLLCTILATMALPWIKRKRAAAADASETDSSETVTETETATQTPATTETATATSTDTDAGDTNKGITQDAVQ